MAGVHICGLDFGLLYLWYASGLVFEGGMDRHGTRDGPTSGKVWLVVLHEFTAQLPTGVFRMVTRSTNPALQVREGRVEKHRAWSCCMGTSTRSTSATEMPIK
jgi:hypothetical protein